MGTILESEGMVFRSFQKARSNWESFNCVSQSQACPQLCGRSYFSQIKVWRCASESNNFPNIIASTNLFLFLFPFRVIHLNLLEDLEHSTSVTSFMLTPARCGSIRWQAPRGNGPHFICLAHNCITSSQKTCTEVVLLIFAK